VDFALPITHQNSRKYINKEANMEDIIRIHSAEGLFEYNLLDFKFMGFNPTVICPAGAILRKQVWNPGASEPINYKVIITRRRKSL
jgi:hypothetical protein